ncbi:MAG: chemotaxis protein CheA [Erythrobacter sp.]
MDELLTDFVAETREMLEAIEGEIIAWESDPSDRARLDAIFRFVHTVKGNCGFFDFPRLAALSHAAEDALADCRSEKRAPDAALVNAVLAIIDRIARMMDAIETGEEFPEGGDAELVAALALDAIVAQPDDAKLDAMQDGGPAGAAVEEEPAVSQDGELHDGQDPGRSTAIATQRSIRLPVDLLDRVMSGVSDMVLARNDLANRLRQAGDQPTIDGPFERLTSILGDVRDAITRMRMQRIETLFNAIPRLVRDLGQDLGKHVTVEIEGGDVELDREMIETIRDPVTHIIRNAIDHGIEPAARRLEHGKPESGHIAIAARQSGNTISVVLSDDGQGLDEDRIAKKAVSSGLITAEQRAAMGRDAILQLIFQPGFSTADEVSAVSGRGVGLDVVRENLERIGGGINVSSVPGAGTMFTLQIPLTLSIIAGLTVGAGGQRFAIPQSYIEEIIHASSAALDFTHVGERSLVTFRGRRVPCLMAEDVLGLPDSEMPERERTVIMLRLASGDLFALGVDRIHAHGDLVVKPLAPVVNRSGLHAGSTLMDDGHPLLLLDIANIASRHELASPAKVQVAAPNAGENDAGSDAIQAMLFTDHSGRRCAIRLELVKRIETAFANAIDRSGQRPHAVIDGVLVPVVGLPEGPLPSEKLRMLRLYDGTCELLFAVREIDDAIECNQPLKEAPGEDMIEAVTLVGDRAVALIDAHTLFARFGEPVATQSRPRCLLPDTEWARGFLAPLVRAAGWDVADRSDGDEAIAIRFEEEVRDPNGPATDERVPVIQLRNTPTEIDGVETIYRYDREALLNALGQARTSAGGTR